LKLVDVCRAFLKETVNLNQNRIDRLDANVDALKDFVRDSNWAPRIRTFEEHGSWAHDTIIRPVDGDEFDADLLVMVAHVDGWSAADYVKTLGTVFSNSGVYKEKAKAWDYCVTITYVGDRKVDLAPCVVGRLWEGSLEVCNRSTNKFERSEPVQYTNWLKLQNSYSGSNSFRKVTRLLKYLRDIKTTFTCQSVLLTTLLGMQINWWDKDTDDFADVPTTLRTVMRRLDDWLQARPYKPIVQNPKLTEEDFAVSMTEAQYANFRSFIHKYRGWVDEAYDIEGRDESIKAWQRVFGDEFGEGEAVKVAKSLSEGSGSMRSDLLTTTAQQADVVERVRQFGLSILPSFFHRQPHMKEPPWIRASNLSSNVQVIAVWGSSSQASEVQPVRSGDVLKPRGGLWFDVGINGGQPVPNDFQVHWRITNTGSVAKARGQERGGFYSPTTPTTSARRSEALKYRGVHIAEAFIIRRSDSLLVGQSPPFSVVIE
jgi:Second Messenger Oligonucleotide or Dinucleotide Synthetase domain/Adenylyl/Guanylyl and SMODS C-terminal sensor domain